MYKIKLPCVIQVDDYHEFAQICDLLQALTGHSGITYLELDLHEVNLTVELDYTSVDNSPYVAILYDPEKHDLIKLKNEWTCPIEEE